MKAHPMNPTKTGQFVSGHFLSVAGFGRLLAITLIPGILVAISCAGPQPLSTAIRPDDEQAYVQRLNAENFNGRTAFLKGAAEQRKMDIATVEKEDSALGAARNPFDAHKDALAVSRGAVIYKFHCARCHGEDARGKGPSALPDHPANDFHSFGNRFASTIHGGAPRRWFKSISEGYGDTLKYPDGHTKAMPPFGDKLAREQIWLAITYLQSLDMNAKQSSAQSAQSSRKQEGTRASKPNL
jgi:mono/diheme cytochrome c family protein